MMVMLETFVGLLLTCSAVTASMSDLRRSRSRPSSHPGERVHVSGDNSVNSGNETATIYFNNWAGAVVQSPPAGSTFDAVSGIFTVPKPSPPQSGNGQWSGSAWVGIDGDTYQKAILQAGVGWTVTSSNGKLSYDYWAWAEWYPSPSIVLDIEVTAGDQISATCISQGNSKGSCSISTNGVTVIKNLTAPSSSAVLAGQNVEWIVEDYTYNGKLVPLANFGLIEFTETVALTTKSVEVYAENGTDADIYQGGQVDTKATIKGKDLYVKYIGPGS